MISSPFALVIFFIAASALHASAAATEKLDWLVGTWNLCDARQSRLVASSGRLVASNNNPQCSDYWTMEISSLDDDPNTFVNFQLEAPFDAPCELFGIPQSACDKKTNTTWLNMTFVGTLSLNPRKQTSINFLGKRSDYQDEFGEWVPITTTLDGERTSLVVDITNKNEIYSDWLAAGRRLTYDDEGVGQQFDILSVRSWKMVKDLQAYCDT